MWPFAPAIVVGVGALIVAFGSLWQAVRQSNFNAELRAKNEQIISLQSGGNSYFYFETTKPSPTGEAHMLFSNTSIKFIGEYPLRDVQVNVISPTGESHDLHYDTVRSDQMGKAILVPTLQFRDDKPIQIFHIFINSSNASFSQQIRFVRVNDQWCRATHVSKYGEQAPLYTWIEPDCFPQGQSEIDWSKP